MNLFRKLFGHVQWLLPLLLSIGLFWISPQVYRLMDPTAGGFDAGVLQVPIVALIWWLGAIGVMWFGLDTFFPTLDRYIDSGGWRASWDAANQHHDPRFSLLYCAGIMAGLLLSFLVCLVAVAFLSSSPPA